MGLQAEFSDSQAPAGRWRGFVRALLLSAALLLATLGGFIVMLDAHDHLAISPAFERAPINANQRFSYPALARSQRFDSVVIGTSTIRLLRPAQLNAELGGKFANLAMNSATAYEQARMLELFVRHHPQARTVLVGIDAVWCTTSAELERYTLRPFPEWMYDANRWNDFLYILNGSTLEQAVRQAQFKLGRREPRFGFDGYKSFLPPLDEYDLSKARRTLYGGDGTPKVRGADAALANARTISAWPYHALDLLRETLATVPKHTRVVLMFVPYHHYYIAHGRSIAGQQLRACKERAVDIATQLPNGHVVDFMFASDLTRVDENYWDPLHYSEAMATRVITDLAGALGGANVDTRYTTLFSARPTAVKLPD
jgi:hypothetical protein